MAAKATWQHSEDHFDGELDFATLGKRRGDESKGSRFDGSVRDCIVGVVEQVKEFGSELNRSALKEWKVFVRTDVDIRVSRTYQVVRLSLP